MSQRSLQGKTISANNMLGFNSHDSPMSQHSLQGKSAQRISIELYSNPSISARVRALADS